MLQLEDKIDNHNIISECYSNPYTLSNYNNYEDIDGIKSFIYTLKSYIPEGLNKDYIINWDFSFYNFFCKDFFL